VSRSLGRPRVHLRSTDSTNERARALAIAGAPHGTLVTAAEQHAGRGRQGRRWSAPANSSLLMSLVLRSPPPLLPLLAALAVCDAVDTLRGTGSGTGSGADTGAPAQIKWPNDIVLEDRSAAHSADEPALAKLAGILIEGRPREGWAVLGIGVNVAVQIEQLPPELQPQRGGGAGAGRLPGALPAATLGREPSEIEPLLEALLDALADRLAEAPELTLAAWRSRDALRGRELSWSDGRGRAEGIDGLGRLIVALDGGGHTALSAGEVHLERLG
jgi:BirA family transcriptional regulator, biotin operon repressor / biotin---[acetyl-CoA-carboxylase] ligase